MSLVTFKIILVKLKTGEKIITSAVNLKKLQNELTCLKQKVKTFRLNYIKALNEVKILVEHSMKLETFVESVNEGLMCVDNNDKITYINNLLCKMLGYKKNELIGKIGFEEIVIPEDRKIIIKKNKLRIKGFTDSYRIRLLTKSGNAISTNVSGSPLKNNKGKITGSIALIYDITKQLEAEEVIKRKNDELNMLVEAGKLITKSLDLNDLYDSIFTNISRVADCAELFVSNYDNETKLIKYTYLRSSQGKNRIDVSNIPPIPLAPKGFGILSKVIRTKQPMVLNDYQKHFKRVKTYYVIKDTGEIIDDTKSSYIPRSALVIPVMYENKVLSVIQLFSERKNAYTVNQLEVLEALMQHVSIATHNATLYNKAQNEIAERIKIEQQLEQSIKEKEILLKEIYHRVKNNLQVISSLIKLQIDFTDEQSTKEFLKMSQTRVKTMALVHEKLYRSDNLNSLNLQKYIETLVTHLLSIYSVKPGFVSVNTNAGNINLGIDIAIPCALIINELVSNSLRHAFPADRKGYININLQKETDGSIQLAVLDNGIGLPAEFDLYNSKGMGMQIVTTLSEQIDGKIEVKKSPLTVFIVKFKQDVYPSRL